MYIKCTNSQTKALKLDWMSKSVEFASTGTAQVDEETGNRLIDEVDAIEPHDNEDSN